MNILIGQKLEDISIEAARLFMSLSRRHIRSSGRFVTALSGGRTPERLYEILASDYYLKGIAWSKVHIFWVDERFVASDHPDSNFRLVQETLLQSITLPQHNIHPIRTQGATASVSAKKYEADVKDFFKITKKDVFPRFDLIILGLGEDGHTASLFPGSKKLGDREHLAVSVQNRKTQHPRITLTLPVLNSARHILFLVSGKSKAPVIKKVIIQRDGTIPASLVNPYDGKCHYFFDQDAGSCLLKTGVKKHATR
jgi:6-phosphogluconolactonase